MDRSSELRITGFSELGVPLVRDRVRERASVRDDDYSALWQKRSTRLIHIEDQQE
jgi:hypothetical protein